MFVINVNNNNNVKKQDDTLINGKVRFPEVRLLSSTGEQLGIMSSKEAAHMAMAQELDLVCISPAAQPPVCKIMNYSKFRYEQEKKAKEAKKNQKVVQLKEIRLSPTIDIGDFNTKAKHAVKFLEAGDKVKVTIKFKGRMIAHNELGKNQLEKFAEACKEAGSIEREPKMDGRQMFMQLTPIKK